MFVWMNGWMDTIYGPILLIIRTVMTAINVTSQLVLLSWWNVRLKLSRVLLEYISLRVLCMASETLDIAGWQSLCVGIILWWESFLLINLVSSVVASWSIPVLTPCLRFIHSTTGFLDFDEHLLTIANFHLEGGVDGWHYGGTPGINAVHILTNLICNIHISNVSWDAYLDHR